MKQIFIFLFFLMMGNLYSQEEKFFSNIDIEIMAPKYESTTYIYGNGPISRVKLDEKTAIKLKDKPAFSLNYSYNYQFWDGLSFGLVTGLYHLPLAEATLSTAKFGGQLRYTFDEDYKVSSYIQVVGFLPLNKYIATEFGEARFGMSFPIIDKESYIFTATLYTSFVSFKIDKPILYDETPGDITNRGFGIGLGIRF